MRILKREQNEPKTTTGKLQWVVKGNGEKQEPPVVLCMMLLGHLQIAELQKVVEVLKKYLILLILNPLCYFLSLQPLLLPSFVLPLCFTSLSLALFYLFLKTLEIRRHQYCYEFRGSTDKHDTNDQCGQKGNVGRQVGREQNIYLVLH